MPIIKSAKKALRQNVRRKKQNIARKQAIKTARKEYAKTTTKEKLTALYKSLDKAAKTNAITKNKASRLKSRMAKRLAKAK